MEGSWRRALTITASVAAIRPHFLNEWLKFPFCIWFNWALSDLFILNPRERPEENDHMYALCHSSRTFQATVSSITTIPLQLRSQITRGWSGGSITRRDLRDCSDGGNIGTEVSRLSVSTKRFLAEMFTMHNHIRLCTSGNLTVTAITYIVPLVWDPSDQTLCLFMAS